MLSHHPLVDATGLVALSLNIGGLLRPSDRALFRTAGWASALWALNNLLIGAQTAAALSVLSVGRQFGAAALLERHGRIKAMVFAALVAATLGIGTLTWHGAATLFPVSGSLAATCATFYLRGAPLRLAFVVVNALWMVSAIACHSPWQIAANGVAGMVAAAGAWRTRAAA